MDKNVDCRRVRTAPLAGGMGHNAGMAKTSRVLRELDRWEAILAEKSGRAAAELVNAVIRDESNESESLADQVETATVRAFEERSHSGVYQETSRLRYLIDKLRLAAKAGILDTGIDQEYAQLRQHMKTYRLQR